MRGLHLTADLRGCAASRPVMTAPAVLRRPAWRPSPPPASRPSASCSIASSGAASVAAAPSGITGVVLLAESHLAVHTWPELEAATLDVYVCNLGGDNSARAETLLATLIDAFRPASVERHALERGGARRDRSDGAMKAMILAAGRGERMRPLSDTTPKPLLEVHGKPLIEWHLEALAATACARSSINTDWLEEQIVATLGDGARFGVAIPYSREGRDHGGALETAGGIAKALPLLGDAFWIVSADIWAPDFRFAAGDGRALRRERPLARLWLVPNPPFHPRGDFGLDADGLGLAEGTGPDGQRWTYANIALARAAMFAGIAAGTHAALAPLLYAGMRERRISAEIYRGRWENVGTPEQLAALNAAPR